MGLAGTGRYLEDLAVGDQAERTVVVQEADIAAFAAVSGDTNPIHLDEDYAATTPFKSRIAHGMLSAAYISALLGTELPGPGAVYLTQSLNFKRAVRIGDELTVRAVVQAIEEKSGKVTLATGCWLGRKVAVDGIAEVVVPRRPVGAA